MLERGKAVRDKQRKGGKSAPPPPVQPEIIAPAPPPVWRKHALFILLLWVCLLSAYSNSFSGAFVFDNSIILQDSRIKAWTPQNIDLIWNQEYWYKWALSGLYRPATTFTYLFNYTILGEGSNPPGYHWINFSLHAINAALVYLLGLVLLGEMLPAFAMALLWSLHPLLTESVTNIVGRADLLATFGILAGLQCHIQAASESGRRKIAWLAGLAAVTAVGFFSKESAVVVLAAMLIHDIAYGGVKLWRARIAGYIAAAIPLAIYLYIRAQVLAKVPGEPVAYGDNPLLGVEFWQARFTAIKVIGKYLWLLICPTTLSSDYSYNQIPLSGFGFAPEDLKAWIALIVCLAALTLGVLCYRRRKAIFFFVLFFFAALAPTANVVMLIGTIMAERFLYVPAIAFAGCLTVAIWTACRHDQRSALALAGVIAAAFLVRTYVRNADYRDERTFWTKAIQTSPHSYKTHMAYAQAINISTSEKSVDQSLEEINKSIAILKPLPDVRQPSFPYINEGVYYREKGELTKKKFANPDEGARAARTWYEKSLEPLLAAKRFEAALNEAAKRRAEQRGERALDFGWWQLNLEAGRTYLALEQPHKAIEEFRIGLRRRPKPELYRALGIAWAAAGDNRRGAAAYMEGLVVDPTFTALTSELVKYYSQTEPRSCAVQQAGGSTSINLACPLVHDDLCAGARNAAEYYVQGDERPKALQVANTAIRELGCPADLFK
jgi:protein O-mannosyl-transferase